MSGTDLHAMTAAHLARLVRGNEVSPVEIVEACLARIEAVNPKLNCFCAVYADEALAAARRAEEAVASGDPLGPLHGVPVAFKDLTPVRGWRTTLGSHLHADWVPEVDAVIVERLRDAGAIPLGKTTTPEFAHSIFTESDLLGITRNPWNLDHSPGGSSGGSGAAVASGCVPLAEGSDMGGSVRVPAAFCGVVGLKPSFGRIPFDILPSQYDQTCHFGPLARSVADAALFLGATQGPDDRDVQSLPITLDIRLPLPADIKGLKVAYSTTLGYATVDAEVEKNFLSAIEVLRQLGATVEEVDPQLLGREQARWAHWNVYYAMMLGDKLPAWRDRMHPGLVRAIEKGQRLGAVEAKRLEVYRTNEWRKLRPIFRDYAALTCPTTAIPAPRVGGSDADYDRTDEAGTYRAIEMCFHFNVVSQCPALSVPSGLTRAGLPTGVQIVGRRFDDMTVLTIGAALENALGWTERRPPL